MNQLVTVENRPASAQRSENILELIKRLFCRNCTDDEVELFLHVCKNTGLDPFRKQIYAIKRGNSLTIQVGIDGFRLIAERTGNYSPGKETLFTYDDKGKIVSATSYIKKRTADGTWHEISATAYMEEYRASQGMWQKMPRAMLSKCAESLALRKAFPGELSGIYSEEEMHQAANSSEIAAEISESQWARLDDLLQDLTQEEIKNLESAISVKTLYEMQPKDYDRIIRSIEKKIKMKEKENGSSAVA